MKYQLEDVIKLKSWETLAEQFGIEVCDDGHECIKCDPPLSYRFINKYNKPMKILYISKDKYYVTDVVTVTDDMIEGLFKLPTIEHAPADLMEGAVVPGANIEDAGGTADLSQTITINEHTFELNSTGTIGTFYSATFGDTDNSL